MPMHNIYRICSIGVGGKFVGWLRLLGNLRKVVVLIFVSRVSKEYLFFPRCNYLRGCSRKIIKRYGLSVTPCIVPLCMGIGCVLSKYSLTNVVVDCE